MADEGERCENEDIILELDIGVNEFDDELFNEDELLAEPSAAPQKSVPQKHSAKESNRKMYESKDEVSMSKKFQNINTKGTKDEEGELLSSDVEMDISESDISTIRGDNRKKQQEGSSSKIKHAENTVPGKSTNEGDSSLHLKRRATSDEVCDEMVVDEEELMKKRQRLTDEPMKDVHKRGGVKKKKRMLSRFIQHRTDQQRHVRPSTEHIFKPITVSQDNTVEEVAAEIADRLEENKTNLIQRLVNCIGCAKALELFQITRQVQDEGGMPTADKWRRRTSGGVFLHLLKTKGFATKEQIKEIYAEENEKAKRLAKEQQAKIRELREAGKTSDLRKKISHEIENNTDKEETISNDHKS